MAPGTDAGGNSRPSGKPLESTLRNLSITTAATTASKKQPQQSQPVSESWEDDDDDDDEEDSLAALPAGSHTRTPPSRPRTGDLPNAPPPTPLSPTMRGARTPDFSALQEPSAFSPGSAASLASSGQAPDRRPEKTTATASRLIAAGLGMRAPRRTDDERAYDRAAAEREKSRRDGERREREERLAAEERARRDVWDG